MNKTAIIITVVVLILGVGAFLYFRNKKNKEAEPVKEVADPIVLPTTPTEVPTVPVESTAVIIEDVVMEHRPETVTEPIVLGTKSEVSANLSRFNFNQLT